MAKVFWIMLVSLFIAVGNVQAHCGKCGIGDAPKDETQNMVKEHLDMIAKDLKLSDEQKAKLEPVLKAKIEKKQEIMNGKQEAMEAVHNDFNSQLQGILTPEQMKQWEAMRGEKGDMKGHCPDCKDGKKCAKCELKNKKCTECKDGKKCAHCALMEKKKAKKDKHHEHDN